MKSVLEVCHSATLLDKILDDVEIIGTSMRESLGVVQDQTRVLRRCELFFNIRDTSFAAVLYDL
jgi:hypothetical protein